jgi:hypothetical protein
MTFTEELIRMLETKRSEIAASLAAGNATNWESYNRIVGQNQGLTEALGMINFLLKEEDEDD